MIVRTILAFATLVVVPLGLRLIPAGPGDPAGTSLRRARRCEGPAAAFLVAALLVPTGTVSAALSLPWLGLTVFLATIGLRRILAELPAPALEACARDAALGFLAVGGGWASIALAGGRPLGFGPTIVLLTAVHFHFAGFALGVIASCVRRARPGFVSAFAVVAWFAGVVGVAVGIGWSPSIEWIAAGVLAASGMTIAALQFVVALGARRRARVLLIAASASLALGMVLAAGYGCSQRFGFAWLSIPQMERVHGVANAFGFAGLGLLGWNLTRPSTTTREVHDHEAPAYTSN